MRENRSMRWLMQLFVLLCFALLVPQIAPAAEGSAQAQRQAPPLPRENRRCPRSFRYSE